MRKQSHRPASKISERVAGFGKLTASHRIQAAFRRCAASAMLTLIVPKPSHTWHEGRGASHSINLKATGVMQTIWLSPTNFVTGDPTLRVSYPFVSHPSTVVSCTAPGDFKWVSMGLRLPLDVQIEGVIICYQISNARSFISQVRLAEMTTPDHATVVHDDPAHLTSTTPATYNSAVPGLVPSGAVTLELRLNFQNISDEILLGAVGVSIKAPTGRCVNSIADLKALPGGAFPCVQLLGYHTPGDGGGGEFFWDASSAEPDDGGTIIMPASNPPIGRWKRVVEGPLSVKWFGAKGNGQNDDGAALQATLNKLSSYGGVLVLPPGIYRPLQPTNLQLFRT